MRLKINVRNGDSSKTVRECIERRMRFALSRFDNRIRRAEVVLDDVNGPRGGADQHCTLTIKLASTTPIVIQATDVDAMAAVGRVADRAARHLSDHLKRRRDLRRHYGNTVAHPVD